MYYDPSLDRQSYLESLSITPPTHRTTIFCLQLP